MINDIIKVRCINNKRYEDYITIGKIYDAICYRGYFIILNNNLGSSDSMFDQERFISLNEYRSEQINKILY